MCVWYVWWYVLVCIEMPCITVCMEYVLFVLHVLVCIGLYLKVICASIDTYWLVFGVYRKLVHILSICMYLQYLYLLICIDMYWNYRLCWYVFVFTDLCWIYVYVMIRIVSIDRCLPLCACISMYLYVLN